jgi:hypothetical protein
LNPQYQAAYKKWSDCANEFANRTLRAFEALAALYPKFGIAYRALSDDMKTALHADGTIDDAAMAEARRRFEDRILQTAEREALEDYNMIRLSQQQRPLEAQCGAIPEPPRLQP